MFLLILAGGSKILDGDGTEIGKICRVSFLGRAMSAYNVQLHVLLGGEEGGGGGGWRIWSGHVQIAFWRI